ncbi:MAG: carbohydrate ABC transporter substrate-binding protein, partial [Ruminococcaceae bacterium]|nr:carbohydrate ABC transporter substrate-binding protein [Oscillospiraceae bacterium]
MKKIICALLALVMMLSLAACGGAAEPKTDNVVTVWAWDEAFNIKAANEAAAIYKTINPDVTIEVVTMAQDDIVQKLNTALAAGSYEGLPEVVLVEDYRIQGFLKNFGNEFADLSDIAKPEDFASFKTAVNVVDGKLYGIPFDSGVAAMFYRLDLVEEAGYTEADMQNITWEKYIEVGKAIKEKCGVDMMTMDPSDLGQIRMMLQSAGSWYTDAEGKVAVANNPA